MLRISRYLAVLVVSLTFTCAAWSAPDVSASASPALPKSAPDSLQLKNGERLLGHLQRISAGKVYFHSDMLGDISVPLENVQDLASDAEFAVLKKGGLPAQQLLATAVPVGRIAVHEQQLHVAGEQPATMPAQQAEYVIQRNTFEREIRQSPAWYEGWHGTVSGGAGAVQSTQDSLSFNEAVSFVRAVPVEPWLPTQDRTSINFAGTYSRVSQPDTPEVRTNILHADAEHDLYLSDKLFFLQQTRFDHNSSQGLNLQQLYGAGFGYTVVKNSAHEFDVRADLHYERQQFEPTAGQSSEDLIGSNLAQSYTLKLPMGIALTQQAVFDPAWNNSSAFSALAKVHLVLPVYRRLGLSMGLIDSFLNNPPDGYKRNSAQFTTGLTYKFN